MNSWSVPLDPRKRVHKSKIMIIKLNLSRQGFVLCQVYPTLPCKSWGAPLINNWCLFVEFLTEMTQLYRKWGFTISPQFLPSLTHTHTPRKLAIIILLCKFCLSLIQQLCFHMSSHAALYSFLILLPKSQGKTRF